MMKIQFLYDEDIPEISEKDPVDIERYIDKVNPDRICPVCGNDFIEYGIEARVWIRGNTVSLLQVSDDPKPFISCIGCGKISPLDTIESE
jgi:hypothetical protein